VLDDSRIVVRATQRDACRGLWDRLARPGTWWNGSERASLVRSVRDARACDLCARRKAALVPSAVSGIHSGMDSGLPASAIEAAHRIATDPGRLTERWYSEVLAGGLSPAQYVEIVGIVAMATVTDTFCRAVGATLPPILDAVPGEPSRLEPEGAVVSAAWVPTLPFDRLPPAVAALFASMRSTLPSEELAKRGAARVGNVMLALSLVPAEQYAFSHLSSAALYRSAELVLTEDQRELVASATSAYNDCFY
jgi:hypothetical protein